VSEAAGVELEVGCPGRVEYERAVAWQ